MRTSITLGLALLLSGACSWSPRSAPAELGDGPLQEATSAGEGESLPISLTSGGGLGDVDQIMDLDRITRRVTRALLGNSVSRRVRRNVARAAADLARGLLKGSGSGRSGGLGALRGMIDRLRRSFGRRSGSSRRPFRSYRAYRPDRWRDSHRRQRGSSKRRREKRACRRGDSLACRRVARMFAEGIGGRASPVLSRVYYRKACRQGHARSCLDLGDLYRKGVGMSAPLTNLARRAYQRGCAAGSTACCREADRLPRRSRLRRRRSRGQRTRSGGQLTPWRDRGTRTKRPSWKI